MNLIVTNIDDEIFTIDSIFSPTGCQSLIEFAEAIATSPLPGKVYNW
ncbi:hypothetical protein [Chamaesiphon sp. VAR_48_metabat_135_sub]|nr:hypothetical protein [Chamaesiphon sp. VAR_48_metabat_135_sub]